MPTRRHFLTTSLAAGLGTQFTGCATPLARGAIDAHVHVWTPNTEAYPLAPGFRKQDMAPPSFTPEQLFAHCRPEGVTRVVLIQMSYYQTDNRYMLDMIAAHPGVFSGVAIVDETAPEVHERMRSLARQGVRGFRLHQQGTDAAAWLDTPAMHGFWRLAAEENLNVCLLINPEALGPVAKMCERHPRTPVVIDHFARLGMKAAPNRAQLDRLLHLSKYPLVTLKTSAFYALGKKQPPYLDLAGMIKECRDQFGADRLMWASDCPFQVDPGHTYHDSIALIRDRLDFLSAADKSAMLHDTAERVFFQR
jgi:predicted TIM-barrel fold metal-dependent hydrolase